MSPRSVLAVIVVVGSLIGAVSVQAQSEDSLIIGTKEAPPFAMKDSSGRWTGLSIELWEEIALELGLHFEIREYDLQGLLDAVASGEVDAGVAALTATGEREMVMDFTHPFYTTGFGIAVAPLQRESWFTSIRRVVSGRFLRWLGMLALLLFVVGGLVWLFERRVNPEHFGGSTAHGLWAGFWWAAVTMTTVGYGDKTPRSVMGRLLSLVWMFTAIALLGVFVAAMTTALTVSQLESPIRGPEDLLRARVATVERSTSEEYLRENRIPYQSYTTLLEALEGIVSGHIDAVVYDAPLLQFQVTNEMGGEVDVLPRTFERQDYCIALPTGSSLREPINRMLLADSTRMLWQDILYRYLQQAPAPPPKPES